MNDKLFEGLSAWFSSSVNQVSKDNWAKHGGTISSSFGDAKYLFSDKANSRDTIRLFEAIDDGINLVLFKSNWIEKVLACAKNGRFSTAKIEEFILLPDSVIQDLKMHAEKYETSRHEKKQRKQNLDEFEKDLNRRTVLDETSTTGVERDKDAPTSSVLCKKNSYETSCTISTKPLRKSTDYEKDDNSSSETENNSIAGKEKSTKTRFQKKVRVGDSNKIQARSKRANEKASEKDHDYGSSDGHNTTDVGPNGRQLRARNYNDDDEISDGDDTASEVSASTLKIHKQKERELVQKKPPKIVKSGKKAKQKHGSKTREKHVDQPSSQDSESSQNEEKVITTRSRPQPKSELFRHCSAHTTPRRSSRRLQKSRQTKKMDISSSQESDNASVSMEREKKKEILQRNKTAKADDLGDSETVSGRLVKNRESCRENTAYHDGEGNIPKKSKLRGRKSSVGQSPGGALYSLREKTKMNYVDEGSSQDSDSRSECKEMAKSKRRMKNEGRSKIVSNSFYNEESAATKQVNITLTDITHTNLLKQNRKLKTYKVPKDSEEGVTSEAALRKGSVTRRIDGESGESSEEYADNSDGGRTSGKYKKIKPEKSHLEKRKNAKIDEVKNNIDSKKPEGNSVTEELSDNLHGGIFRKFDQLETVDVQKLNTGELKSAAIGKKDSPKRKRKSAEIIEEVVGEQVTPPTSVKRKRKLYRTSSSGLLLENNEANVSFHTPKTSADLCRKSVDQTLSPTDIHDLLNGEKDEQILLSGGRRSSSSPTKKEICKDMSPSVLVHCIDVEAAREKTMSQHKKMVEQHKKIGEKNVEDFTVGSFSGFTHIDDLDIPIMKLQDFIVNKNGCRVKLVRVEN